MRLARTTQKPPSDSAEPSAFAVGMRRKQDEMRRLQIGDGLKKGGRAYGHACRHAAAHRWKALAWVGHFEYPSAIAIESGYRSARHLDSVESGFLGDPQQRLDVDDVVEALCVQTCVQTCV